MNRRIDARAGITLTAALALAATGCGVSGDRSSTQVQPSPHGSNTQRVASDQGSNKRDACVKKPQAPTRDRTGTEITTTVRNECSFYTVLWLVQNGPGKERLVVEKFLQPGQSATASLVCEHGQEGRYQAIHWDTLMSPRRSATTEVTCA